MRAGLVLQALACRFDVHLFVVPVAGEGGEVSEFVRRHTVRVGSLELSALSRSLLRTDRAHFGSRRTVSRRNSSYPKPQLSRFCTSESARRVMEWVGAERIDAVHVMRLYLAPLAEGFLRLPPSARPDVRARP